MTQQEVIKTCINKQLEPYAVTYDDVQKGGRYNTMLDRAMEEKEVPWYQYYTFNSEQEFNDWKEFCINLFRKELKMSKDKAETEFAWFNLNYGLKQNYEVKI